jgi:hypothetical protein
MFYPYVKMFLKRVKLCNLHNDALPTSYRGKKATRSGPGASESEPARGPDRGGASSHGPEVAASRINAADRGSSPEWMIDGFPATSVAAAPAHGSEWACSVLFYPRKFSDLIALLRNGVCFDSTTVSREHDVVEFGCTVATSF